MASLLIEGLHNPNSDAWKLRHNRAVANARHQYDCSASIIRSLYAWHDYATDHNKRFESLIGEDYVLGPMWEHWGTAMRGLLNDESGALDCGTIDGFILDTLAENGVDTSKL